VSRIDSAKRHLSAADLCSAIVGCALVTASLSSLFTEPTYDEAVYLRLARTIAERGLPLRRAYEDFSRFGLFENSPPLVAYLASISQTIFPGNDIPARLVHIVTFVVPTYLVVWWIVRVKFGEWAAFGSLVALLTSISYLRATGHVLLNAPLGLLSCVALVAFHAACSHRDRQSSVLAAVALFLAVWTKYQAICIAVAIIVYVTYTVAIRGFDTLRSMFVPLSALIVSGAIAVAMLVWFYWAFGGDGAMRGTLTLNVDRMTPASRSFLDIGRGVIHAARRTESTVGGALLLLGALAIFVEDRHRGLLVLLTSYVGATIAFNLILFRLPGAGSSYLHSGVPALALLAGPAAARIVAELARTTVTRTILASAVVAIQIASSSAFPDEIPQPNGSRAAAKYIAAHSRPDAGVLAETVAIDFYSGHPVRPLGNTYPRQLVLRSLEGTSGDDISFVAANSGAPPKNLDDILQEWNRLLAEHFEPISIAAPGLQLYRRRLR
jgi:hypothetical protein